MSLVVRLKAFSSYLHESRHCGRLRPKVFDNKAEIGVFVSMVIPPAITENSTAKSGRVFSRN